MDVADIAAARSVTDS